MAERADTGEQRRFQAPRGTRDFYPPEMLRRRWIEQRWRRAAVRHGFEEIDGPRFEHLDLYTVKSGEGIVSELFSFQREGGEDRYALRPEFTPTLARMAAARAQSLPKPTKWFSVGPYFRAERPQRGRLREFLQWNVDVIGDDSPAADAELIACCIDFLAGLGFSPDHVQIKIGHRGALESWFKAVGIGADDLDPWLALVDRRDRMSDEEFEESALKLGATSEQARKMAMELELEAGDLVPARQLLNDAVAASSQATALLASTVSVLERMNLAGWVFVDRSIARGLAYYTGMVFEVHEATGKERAIAGGGRYDNLVELFGGPPTPAVGFAMGDVVLANVLQDKGLMPSDEELAEELSLRPDVFVISTGDDASEARLRPVVARLRRAGLHARHTYRSTRNIGKLLKEASGQNARFAVILEADGAATLKDLESGEEAKRLNEDDLAARIRAASDHDAPA